jgi:hypothetical protein
MGKSWAVRVVADEGEKAASSFCSSRITLTMRPTYLCRVAGGRYRPTT